jgi:hypothetical protein
MFLLFALMIPAVTVDDNESGFPIAITHWPTLILSESPRYATGKSFASILITPKSVNGSVPITVASKILLSWRVTLTCFASFTTWLFVRMYPSSEIIIPLPPPSCSCGASLPNGSLKKLWNGALLKSFFTEDTTVIWTMEGVTFSATWIKALLKALASAFNFSTGGLSAPIFTSPNLGEPSQNRIQEWRRIQFRWILMRQYLLDFSFAYIFLLLCFFWI